jgi:hypothetical protein
MVANEPNWKIWRLNEQYWVLACSGGRKSLFGSAAMVVRDPLARKVHRYPWPSR